MKEKIITIGQGIFGVLLFLLVYFLIKKIFYLYIKTLPINIIILSAICTLGFLLLALR